MKVSVTLANEVHELEFKDKCEVNEILKKLEIPPSLAMVIYNQQVIPHTSKLSDDVEIEVIIVASGG